MVKHMEDYVRTQLADYIRVHRANIEVVARDFLKRKGQLLEDYLEFIQHPGHRGDELSVYLLGCMGNRGICVITKTRYWSTFEEADINLVYLGRSVFWNTILKAKKSGSMYKQEGVNEHDSVPSDDSFRRHTRSMDHAKRPTPSPSPECPVKKAQMQMQKET